MALFTLAAGIVFAQTDSVDSADVESGDAATGSVPLEMLRPRREEPPRYPVDVVIGPMGQGDASFETYSLARNIAAALFAGNVDSPVLAPMERLFLEDYVAILASVNPRSLRIGSGRESPDGSVSFLVRFLGREFGITGELFVRRVELPSPQVAAPPSPPAELEEVAEVEVLPEEDGDDSGAISELSQSESGEGEEFADASATGAGADVEVATPPAPVIPARVVWIFDELILESPRDRDEENRENRQHFGPEIYHRLF